MADALVDTGVFVALLSRTDRWHDVATEGLRATSGRLLTSWAVLTETTHLVSRPDASLEFLAYIARGAVEIPQLGLSEIEAMTWYQRKYAELRPDLADLSLLVLADLTRTNTVLTFDRDFLIYRSRKGRAFNCPLLD